MYQKLLYVCGFVFSRLCVGWGVMNQMPFWEMLFMSVGGDKGMRGIKEAVWATLNTMWQAQNDRFWPRNRDAMLLAHSLTYTHNPQNTHIHHPAWESRWRHEGTIWSVPPNTNQCLCGSIFIAHTNRSTSIFVRTLVALFSYILQRNVEHHFKSKPNLMHKRSVTKGRAGWRTKHRIL